LKNEGQESQRNCLRNGFQWKRGGRQERVRRANMVEVLSMYENGKMRPIEIILRKEVKGKDGGDQSNEDILLELLEMS
jgi:hypothetical protein